MKKSLSIVAVMLVVALFAPTMALANSPVAALPATVDVAGSDVPEGATLFVEQASSSSVSSMKQKKDELGINGTLIAVLDINLANATAGSSATIRVSCPGLYANGSVVVLHQKADGTVEQIQASCYNGGFTFTVNSFSPFGFVLQDAGSSTSRDRSTPSSPQTGVYE